MIILLTGPTASGKTDTGWALFERLPKCVFLESDAFAAKRPFADDDQQDLLTVWDQILVNLKFHQARSVTDFIVSVSPPMAGLYHLVESELASLDLTIYPFRLDCRHDEALKRITLRGCGEEQEARERQWLIRDRRFLDENDPAAGPFVKIDTTELTESVIAENILSTIGL